MTDTQQDDQELKEDSPWTYPMIIIGVLVLLSGAVLYYYFGPSLAEIRGDSPQASARSTPIQMQIGDNSFVVPEHYTQYPRARRGGPRDSVALYAVLPNLEPYSLRTDQAFFTNEADNPVVYFQIALNRQPMTEAERVSLLYFDSLESGEGEEMPFGLTFYRFRSNSPYADQDLFLRVDDNGDVVALLCSRLSELVPSPNCRRDLEIPGNLTMSYRFKRAHLEDWEMIDTGLQQLAESFRDLSN